MILYAWFLLPWLCSSYLLGVSKLTLDWLLHLLLRLLRGHLEINIWLCGYLRVLWLQVLLLHRLLLASIENVAVVSLIRRHANCYIAMSELRILGHLHHLHLHHWDLVLVLPRLFGCLFRLLLMLVLLVLNWSLEEGNTAATALYAPENKLGDGEAQHLAGVILVSWRFFPISRICTVIFICRSIAIISAWGQVVGANFSWWIHCSRKKHWNRRDMATACATKVQNCTKETWIPPEATERHKDENCGLQEHPRAIESPNEGPVGIRREAGRFTLAEIL